MYIDFKIDDKYIEVIDPESDLEKFKMIKKNFPELKILGIGKSNHVAMLDELESFFRLTPHRIK